MQKFFPFSIYGFGWELFITSRFEIAGRRKRGGGMLGASRRLRNVVHEKTTTVCSLNFVESLHYPCISYLCKERSVRLGYIVALVSLIIIGVSNEQDGLRIEFVREKKLCEQAFVL